jgi:hypothetical protein
MINTMQTLHALDRVKRAIQCLDSMPVGTVVTHETFIITRKYLVDARVQLETYSRLPLVADNYSINVPRSAVGWLLVVVVASLGSAIAMLLFVVLVVGR